MSIKGIELPFAFPAFTPNCGQKRATLQTIQLAYRHESLVFVHPSESIESNTIFQQLVWRGGDNIMLQMYSPHDVVYAKSATYALSFCL